MLFWKLMLLKKQDLLDDSGAGPWPALSRAAPSARPSITHPRLKLISLVDREAFGQPMPAQPAARCSSTT